MKKIINSLIFAAIVVSNVNAQAVLPTAWSFTTTTLPVGWTESGTAFYSASGNTPPAMKFDNTGDYLIVNYANNAGTVSYYLAGNSFSGGTFTVEESEFGTAWTTLFTHTAPPAGTYTQYTHTPLNATRFIRFIYTNKVSGNIGLDDVNITAGAAGPEQEINVKQGATTILSGGSFPIISPVSTMTPTTFTIENSGLVNALTISSVTLTGAAASDYSIAIQPASVASTGSESLVVNFTPSVAGTRPAVLTITNDDSDESVYLINLYGIGGSFASEPASSATNLNFTNVKTYRLTGSFSPVADAEGYLVVRKKGSAITGTPVDGTVYQRGDIVGDAQVVYSSNGTSFIPNNIVANTGYYFAVFPYNGASTYRNYKTSSPLANNVTTPATMVPATEYAGISTSAPTFVTDLHNLVNPHTLQFYSNYNVLMVKNFTARDTTLDRRVVTCVYSGENKLYIEPFDFTANGFSREHTYPHSWMPTNPAQSLPEYNDYHHLFPTNQDEANAVRSNFPLGDVVTTSVSYLDCKFGQNADGKMVFEPRDAHKGNSARAMMYESICYTGVSGNLWGFPTNISSTIPYGQDQNVIKQWNLQDLPDDSEIARNDYLDSLQGNRNPFVDNPNYACFIDFVTMTYHAQGCNLDLNEALENSVMIFPVPAKNELFIQTVGNSIMEYELMDVQGRSIEKRGDLSTLSLKLDISTLNTGTYFVQLLTSQGTILKKIVVE